MGDYYEKLKQRHSQLALAVFVARWVQLHMATRSSAWLLSAKGLGGLAAGVLLVPLTLGLGSYLLTRLIFRRVPLSYVLFVAVGWLTLIGSGIVEFEATSYAFDWLYR
jgi:hypothetical protein